MKIYEGICSESAVDRTVVMVLENGVRRKLKHHIHHSPDGFSWGYLGSGPAELARCILWDHLGHTPHPMLYRKFKRDYVAKWPNKKGWAMNSEAIDAWLHLNRCLPRTAIPLEQHGDVCGPQ